MGLGLNGIGLNGYWPNWELDQVALEEMALDEMGLDEVAIDPYFLCFSLFLNTFQVPQRMMRSASVALVPLYEEYSSNIS